MSKKWTDNREPDLEELLGDELIQPLLRLWGRDADELRAEMRAARERLQRRTLQDAA
jgi:hypothetical protein